MFKKIIFIVAFVLVYGFLAIYLSSNPGNDSSDYSNGGTIRNNVYENTKYGFNINLSDNWVYYTPETINQTSAGKYGIDLTDISGASILVGFSKPSMNIACAKLSEPISSRDMNLPSLREIAMYTGEYLEMSGYTVRDSDAGIINTNHEVYYYYVDCDINCDLMGEDSSIMYVLFNCGKENTFMIAAQYKQDDRHQIIRFFEQNLKFTTEETTQQGSSL